MDGDQIKHTAKRYRWLIPAMAIFFIVILLSASSAYALGYFYRDHVFPGVYLGGQHIGGLTEPEAKNIIDKTANRLETNGIKLKLDNKETALMTIGRAQSNDLAFEVIAINREETTKNAFAYGRQESMPRNIINIFRAYFLRFDLPLSNTMNEPEIKRFIKEEFNSFENEPVDSRLATSSDKISLTESKPGKTIKYDEAMMSIKKAADSVSGQIVELSVQDQEPRISRDRCLNPETKANRILALAPFFLTASSTDDSITPPEKKSWALDNKTLASLLELQPAESQQDNCAISIGKDNYINYLKNSISPDIRIAPKQAKFEVKGGKVTAFQSSEAGQDIDYDLAFSNVQEAIAQGTSSAILPITKLAGETANKSAEDLGIREIIGTGHSNFSGSPKNRRTNIRVGSSKLEGQLIAPGEEFSTIKAIGQIDGTTGFLQELVIKGNKTTPEYGGGLCQVGTTMFRAALKSGLPITMRRNHSYRVSYYEPAGTDATIYDPLPDFRFMNDTGNYILIQYRIEGNNLYFDFWGTKDGRTATSTYPRIYNIVKPAPTKIIETTELKPGEKKCTEKAHNGADASFKYTVNYPTGETKEKVFNSHYVPWQEVCLLGVSQLSSSTPPITPVNQSSSSPPTTNTTTSIIN